MKIYFKTILISLFSVLIFSCEKENIEEGFTGSWVTKKTAPSSFGYGEINYYIELSETTFTETFLDIHSHGGYGQTDYVQIEGSIAHSGNIIFFNPHKISHYYYDITKSDISNPNLILTEDKYDIKKMASHYFQVTSGYNVEYKLSDNELTLKVDYNSNGDFSDDHEPYTYLRK